MTNLLNSILQEEIGNSSQINLYLINGNWKAYEVSARRLSALLGDKSCQKEVAQGYQFDSLCITPELLLEKNLVNYCRLLGDDKVILDYL